MQIQGNTVNRIEVQPEGRGYRVKCFGNIPEAGIHNICLTSQLFGDEAQASSWAINEAVIHDLKKVHFFN